MKGEEEEKKGEEIISPENTSPPQGTNDTEHELDATLATLGTPVKPKRKKSRPSQMYFRTRNSTRIRQIKTQTPTRVSIIIDESPRKQEEIGPSEGKIVEATPPRTKNKSPTTPVIRPTTRYVTFNKPRTQFAFEEEEKEKLHERHGLLREGKNLLHAE